MKTRSAELRERHRRVLAWSLGIAAALHVLAFVFWPSLRTGGGVGFGFATGPGLEEEAEWIFVDVFFGPPRIYESDGRLSTEPPERVLEAERAFRLSTSCSLDSHVGRIPARGQARLRVDDEGYAAVLEVTRTTGYECGDEVLSAVGGDLRYLWLPNERFPAPVELLQPITLARAWKVTGS